MSGRLRQLLVGLAAAAVALACATAASAAAPSGGGPLATALFPFGQGNGLPCPGVCYVPSQLQRIYDFPRGHGAPTGAGQTIVLVDAYGAPDLQSDLAAFDAEFGLPAANVTVVNQQVAIPGTQGTGDLLGWEEETLLDVEYAHATAPGASLVVAVAASDDTADLAETIREVVPQYPGAIVSQSFGQDETGPFSDPGFAATVQPAYWNALLQGGTIVASSGDAGASNGTEFEGLPPTAMASFPASSPLVLAVGGTMGAPYPGGLAGPGGQYGGEQVWNEPQFGGASGGALSTLFQAPWQLGLTGSTQRAVPDVAYNAAIDGGVVIVLSCVPDGQGGLACDPSHPVHTLMGGTSAGAPQWAGILALANELRGRQGARPVGLVAPLLYQLARDPHSYRQDFHDVLAGNNALGFAPFGYTSPVGFPAGPGYDLATGLGSPDVSQLLRDLAGARSGSLSGLQAPPPHGRPDRGGRGHGRPGR